MKFDIETTFDIGDVVYAADHYYDYYAVREPYVVNDIIININNNRISVMYCVEQPGRIDRFPEEWLFHTYEECTKWCKERNGSL